MDRHVLGALESIHYGQRNLEKFQDNYLSWLILLLNWSIITLTGNIFTLSRLMSNKYGEK
jgi:hypothetical protein